MTTMLTWQAEDGHGLEGTRLLAGPGGFRALGRMVRTDAAGGFTASYRLVVGEDGVLTRLSIATATAQRERHLTVNRTEDGVWLLDTGSGTGETRSDFTGAVDVDVAFSPLFTTLPIRRLGLHRRSADHTLPVVFVALPDLEVRLVEQTYRTTCELDESSGLAQVGLRWDDSTADVVVDADAVVVNHPGVARRLAPVTSS